MLKKCNNPIKDEHYISRVYLKGFAEVKHTRRNENAFIWEYDLQEMRQIPNQVNTKTVCFEKNLYELRDQQGNIAYQNIIEKAFSRIETKIGPVIESIIEKSTVENCLNCGNVLSEDDQSFLIILMTMLRYRTPEVIDLGIKALQIQNPAIDLQDARNFTLMNLLPLGLNVDWDKNTIIRTATERYAGMAFQIGIATDDVIITSDKPVIEFPPKENELYNRPSSVVFPLSSRLVLYLFPIEDCPIVASNCFVSLNADQIRDIQLYVANQADRWIFSKEPLTDDQIKIITETRDRIR